MVRSTLPNRQDADFGEGAARALQKLDGIKPLYPFNLAGENLFRANAIREAGYALIASGWTSADAGRIVRTSATEEARSILEECAIYDAPSPDENPKRGRKRDDAWSDDRGDQFLSETKRMMKAGDMSLKKAAEEVARRFGETTATGIERMVSRAYRLSKADKARDDEIAVEDLDFSNRK